PCQRARLVDGTEWSDVVHEVGAAAICGDGQSAADDFAERGEVCVDIEILLNGAVVEAEAGDDFVHDEKRVVHAGEFAEVGEEACSGRTTPMLAAMGSTMTAAI